MLSQIVIAMKKLSLYVFLVLLVCNNVNADLNSKDKFIFLCHKGNDQSTLYGGGWEINLKKMTATTIYITTSGEITSFEEYPIVGGEGAYVIRWYDLTRTFYVKKGEVHRYESWGNTTTITKCEIID